MNEPEFVRGNQRNYIRIPCNAEVTESYEYLMCINNEMKELLSFQLRTQNGEHCLYYQVSGMQSMDIILQSQKLKRTFVVAAAQSIRKLCSSFSEYVLDIEKIVWNPKYVMIQTDSGEMQFLYDFGRNASEDVGRKEMESFWEYCVEHLDYQDELLMRSVFHVYETLLDQADKFILGDEVAVLLEKLSGMPESEKAVMVGEPEAENIFEIKEGTEEIISVPFKSHVLQKEGRKRKIGLVALLCMNLSLLIWWKPLTLLKLFLVIAVGSILLWLNIFVRRKEKQQRREELQQQETQGCTEAYKELEEQHLPDGKTCIISLEENSGALYNLQNEEPQCIYISENEKIIGKDGRRAQVQITQEGISRVHALVYREGGVCLVEDLNSTNGTWINGNALMPREPYILKDGDKVCFAGTEYIFR